MTDRRKGPELPPWSSTVQGRVDWGSLGDDLAHDLRVFAGASAGREVREHFSLEVAREVAAIEAAVQGCDAFDVIELLRLREIPPVPALSLKEGYDGSSAVIDLVSLVLLAREHRAPNLDSEAQPHKIIPELHDRSKRLLRLATFAIAARAASENHDALARLASEYQSFLVSVRSLQYDSIQSAHDRALFDRGELDQELTSRLGFTYQDFATVRAAIQERYSRTLTELRDVTGGITMAAHAENRELTEAEATTFRNSMIAFMFLPGERASFTAAEIAAESGLDLPTVEAVLHAFSIEFDGERDSKAVILDFLRGVNPLARTSLVRDSAGNYIMTGLQIGTDSFRVIAEAALKSDAKVWRRYDRIRKTVSEAIAIRAVEKLMQTPPTLTNLEYIAPKESHTVDELASTCTSPFLVGDQVECDALFIVEDVAICVEVKGRTIADPARRGDLIRLRREIRETFGGGAEQARRLEALIEVNHGLWLVNGDWLDLNHVREIRSVVVGLDFFGPLTVAFGDLERAGILEQGRLPWIASLHDVDVISRVLERPAEFLLYLRRRSDSGVATHYRGADELDLFMLFLQGGLYVEPDPDAIRQLHPKAGPARNRDRRHHEADARPTIVATHTDPLDAWMYFVEDPESEPADKPTFNSHPDAVKIIDFLADGRKPGWLRFGADLLSLSGEVQKSLGRSLRELVRKTISDDRWHSLTQGYAGMWGYPTLFAATWPRSHTRNLAIEKLYSYMLAKKHQIQSDRSLGILLDLRGNITYVNYVNTLPDADEELDRLGETIGLAPAGYTSPPIPPSARRRTKRLRGLRRPKKNRNR